MQVTDYENTYPYPKKPTPSCECGQYIKHKKFCPNCGVSTDWYIELVVEHNQEMQNYRDAGADKIRKFKFEALVMVGLWQHKNADKIWAKAWEDGHSHGLYSVWQELEELAELF